jgi:hypothetical protein
VLLLLNRTFTSGELQVERVALIFTGMGVFIGVQGGVTDLVKSVTCQVVPGRPSHVVGWPWSLASTDLQLRIPLYRLWRVSPRSQPARLQGGVEPPGGLAGWPPSGPTGQLEGYN